VRVQELRGELQYEIATRRVAGDDDVGRGHASVQQMLDGENCLAQLLWEGVFWCESCMGRSTRKLASQSQEEVQ
jgi:hypothetical protein